MPKLIDGIDFVTGNVLSFQQMNRMKNHWYSGADPPSDPVNGMVWVKNDGTVYFYFNAWVELAGKSVISDPPSGGYRIKKIRLDSNKHMVVVYDETPIP